MNAVKPSAGYTAEQQTVQGWMSSQRRREKEKGKNSQRMFPFTTYLIKKFYVSEDANAINMAERVTAEGALEGSNRINEHFALRRTDDMAIKCSCQQRK